MAPLGAGGNCAGLRLPGLLLAAWAGLGATQPAAGRRPATDRHRRGRNGLRLEDAALLGVGYPGHAGPRMARRGWAGIGC